MREGFSGWRSARVLAVVLVLGAAGCGSMGGGGPVSDEPMVTGPTSLLDLRWASLSAPALSAAGEGSAPVREAPAGAAKGRVTPEAVPALPPMPKAGVWRPTTPTVEKPDLPVDLSLVKVRHRPPVPGVEELLRGAESPEASPKPAETAKKGE